MDPRAREFYGPDEGLPELPALLETFLAWAAETPRRNWQLAVALREDSATVVGSCGLRRVHEEPDLADLGIDLAPALWGLGYGTEAASAMLDFGFDALGLSAVRGRVVSANRRVEAMIRRLCFRFVGTHSGPAWITTRGWHCAEWELTADAWRSRPS
jgi:RimJ/RimL family protein N-acetyltransferase